MRAAIGLWVRNEVARRGRTLVALGVLAGLAGGLTLAAVAGDLHRMMFEDSLTLRWVEVSHWMPLSWESS